MNQLLSLQSQGAVFLILLFLLCAIAVHLAVLARIGWRSFRHRTPPPETPPKPKPEPVYFLVERKKKRTKSEYSPPKEIKFQ